jgi:hypothetical protein
LILTLYIFGVKFYEFYSQNQKLAPLIQEISSKILEKKNQIIRKKIGKKNLLVVNDNVQKPYTSLHYHCFL